MGAGKGMPVTQLLNGRDASCSSFLCRFFALVTAVLKVNLFDEVLLRNCVLSILG